MASTLRHDRGFWEEVVRAYETSGASHAAFAQQRGVSVSALRHWLYKLRRERSARRATSVRILPITVAPAPTPELVEVGVDGLIIRFRAGTDAGYIAQVVTALRAHG